MAVSAVGSPVRDACGTIARVGTHSPVRVGIVVFDGADELDVVGPHAVLSAWAAQDPHRPRITLFSPDGAPARSAAGLDLIPTGDLDAGAGVHVLIHPGGPGAMRLAKDPGYLSQVRAWRRQTPLLAAVGSAVVPLAAAGLLVGRAVSCHPGHTESLIDAEPGVLIDTGASQVDDGDLVTCAAGGHAVQLALHLIERLAGTEACVRVRRSLHFEPPEEPPLPA